MDTLRSNHLTLLKERTSVIRRGLSDQIDRRGRLIAVKGSRGVGKTNFLLDYCRDYYPDDSACLYVNTNNLFFSEEGIFHFAERFYKLGGKVLLLDQVHKYPYWDRELRMCYDAFPELQIVFTISSIARVKSNEYLKGIVEMYNLSGLSFREFLELESGISFPVYSFRDIAEHHETIAPEILSRIRPLAYFENYLRYGYYPIYLEEKSHIDYLLKNINLTLEFDIPYANQIDLKYLPKLKKLLYLVARDNSGHVNISRLSTEIGVSRATVLNYLYYMKNARLLTLPGMEDSGKKPGKLYLHNPNLLNAVCLDNVDQRMLRKTFLLSQLCPVCTIECTDGADFRIDGRYDVTVCLEGEKQNGEGIVLEDMLEKGAGNTIPLWLTGFAY